MLQEVVGSLSPMCGRDSEKAYIAQGIYGTCGWLTNSTSRDFQGDTARSYSCTSLRLIKRSRKEISLWQEKLAKIFQGRVKSVIWFATVQRGHAVHCSKISGLRQVLLHLL